MLRHPASLQRSEPDHSPSLRTTFCPGDGTIQMTSSRCRFRIGLDSQVGTSSRGERRPTIVQADLPGIAVV